MADPTISVRDAMSPDAPTTAADDTLLASCRDMHLGGIGSVSVIDGAGRCVGVLSSWDVVRAIAQGADLEGTTAGEIVGWDRAAHPDDDVEQLVGKDHAGSVIPVVEDGRYVGAIGPGDAIGARTLITVLGPAAARVDLTIAPGDRMYGKLRGQYLLAGTSALVLIRTAMAEAGMREDPEVILDLPCGHGRVMRVLRAAFPGSTLIACDIDRDGVDFCAETFGAVPVYSDTDPARVRIEQQVDLIWVGSLFTHIDPAGWDGFLDLFAGVLRPGGVLVLSTFDRPRLPFLGAMNLPDVERLLRDRDERGVAFQSYLHDEGYGISLASADHVRQAVAFGGKFEILRHEPLSLFLPVPTQDVWMCRRAGASAG
jgi:SAM-dependent methyltransferase